MTDDLDMTKSLTILASMYHHITHGIGWAVGGYVDLFALPYTFMPAMLAALVVATAKDRNPITSSLFGAVCPPAFLIALFMPARYPGYGVNPDAVPVVQRRRYVAMPKPHLVRAAAR